MEVRFYDKELNFLGITENQRSLLWTRRYWESGEFELHLPITDDAVSLCQKENIVTYVGAREAGVIEDITISENIDMMEITVKGRFLSSYFDRRLILGTVNFTGMVEVAMRQLVTNATPIPFVELGTLQGLTKSVTFQATYRNLLTYLTKLSFTSGYGFRLRPDFTEKKIYFEVYEGTDRSRGNGGNSFVEFSDDFDNLNGTEYNYNDQLFKNVGYVGGEGEGASRVFVMVGDTTATGLDRREVFIDAKDIRKDNLSDTAYREALAQRGYERLIDEYVQAETFECVVSPLSNFMYRQDYDLGDIVTVSKDTWGRSLNLRITEVMEVYEDGAYTIIPTIGETVPTSLDTEDDSEDDLSADVTTLKTEYTQVQNQITYIQSAIGENIAKTNLPLSSDVNAYSVGETPYYCKRNGVVQVSGAVAPIVEIAEQGTFNIGTLPVGCRPQTDMRYVCQGSGTNIWFLRVYANGTLRGERYRSGNTYNVIPTTAWLPFSVTFVTA